MHKKLMLLLIFISGTYSFSHAQDEQSLLSAPDDWLSERLAFPLSFAPSIELEGFEDLKFTPKWSDSTNQTFWTYTFVWYTKTEFPLSEENLSKSLDAYFDGLMGVDPKKTAEPNKPNATLSVFIKNQEGYKGRIRVHDSFFTKKEMILHVKVRELPCSNAKEQYILFQLSSKDFEHKTWKVFENVHFNHKCD